MKQHRHLTPEEVPVLLRGDLSAEAIRLAVRFLVAGCPVCMEVIRQGVMGPDDLRAASRPEDPRADA